MLIVWLFIYLFQYNLCNFHMVIVKVLKKGGDAIRRIFENAGGIRKENNRATSCVGISATPGVDISIR